MRKLFAGFFALIFAASGAALASEKTRSALQTDLGTYKLREYNASVNYDRLIDITDSMAVQTKPGIDAGNSLTVTEATHGDALIYLSASGGNAVVTLPDFGTETDAEYGFIVSSAPTSSYTITISMPTGDNSTFSGYFMSRDTEDSIIYASAASAGADKITLGAHTTAVGDRFKILSGGASTAYISGILTHDATGGVRFSSAVASTD